MSSLEQMKKDDLVVTLRSAQQENKSLQTEVEELKVKIAELESANNSDNIGNSNQEELPYLAVSQFREVGGKGGRVVKMRYDLQGNAKIISNERFGEHYKVNWEAVKFLETEIEKQMESAEDFAIRQTKEKEGSYEN